MRGFNQNHLYALVLCITIVQCYKIQVTIPDGTVEGSTFTDYDGGQFYGFKRIPYAKPPVGEFRFKVAEKNTPWEGILDATQEMPFCRQPNSAETQEMGQEDCLYLNVFTNALNASSLKPVMIYIHGGKFAQGTGSEFGAEFIMPQDILLVTINYRLGVYGFLNTVNSEIASDAEEFGNNGFKDQVLAMKWVQKNINYFGGDPGQVTVSGESAGGMSVHAHLLSPLSAGLFHRAIAMSGTTTMVMVPTKNDTATPIANYLGYSTTNYTEMMTQLRQASHADLFKAAKALKWFEIQLHEACLTCLVIEKPGANSFVSDYPMKLIKTGKYSKVPLMLGSTNREGLLIYSLAQANIQDLATHIPFFFSEKQEALKKVEQFYNITTTSNDNIIDMYTDIWFKYNVYRTALEHSKTQINDDVFYYEFAGDAELNYLKNKIPGIANFNGACHADELGYLFYCSGMPEKGSMEEKIMKEVVTMWADFVKTGRPIKKLQPFQAEKYNFVNITNHGLQIGVLNEKSFAFWDDMYKVHGNGLY